MNPSNLLQSSSPGRYPARPVFLLLLGLTAGIVAGRYLPGQGPWLASGALVLGLALTACWLRRSAVSATLPLACMVLLGYLSLQPWMHPAGDARDIRHFIPAKRAEIIAAVAARPVAGNQRLRTVLDLHQIRRAGAWQDVAGRLRLVLRGDSLPPLEQGDRLMLMGKLRAIRNFANPGGFDYVSYLAWQGIHGSLYAKAADVRVVQKAPAGRWPSFKWLRSRMHGIIDTFPRSRINGDQRALLKALLLGERGGIPRDLKTAFARTGTAHLLAISGLHVGMVAGAVYGLLVFLLGFQHNLLLRAWPRKIAALGAIAMITFYALLSGMAPSTQRALIMASLALAGLVMEREPDLFNLLAWAALAILVWYPPALFTLSFQLSFGAVFWIIFGLHRLRSLLLQKREPELESPALGVRILRWVILSALVTLLATLGTLPLIVRTFNQVSLVGLGCNLLLVPLVGWWVLPLGLLGVGTAFFSVSLAGGLLQAAAVPLGWVCRIVRQVADLPWAAADVVSFSILETACYYLLLGCLLSAIGTLGSGEEAAGPSPPAELSKNRRRVCIVGGIVLAVALADIGYWVHRRYWADDLRITVLDVGQGAAVVVEAPGGDVILADGGGFADTSTFDIGARVVAPFLRQRKIASVQVLVLTHPNSDHLNGLLYIAEHFNVGEFWSNGQPAATQGYRRLLEIVDQQQIARRLGTHGCESLDFKGLRAEILYPPRDFLKRIAKQPWADSNNNSLVLKLTHGDHSVLVTGDIMAPAERELAALAGRALKSTVLIVPHHGSRSSSTPAFLEQVRPRYAIIPCGWRNRYRFPHETVLQRLDRHCQRIFRTDLDGAVTLHSDGRRLTLKAAR